MRNSGSSCGYRCCALVLALAVPMAALLLTATAFGGDAKHRQSFIGFWEGVDPLDGSTVQVSISDIEGDGVLEVIFRESFFTFCFQLGSNYSLGRGLVTGEGMVVSKGVLEVESRFTCISDDNNPGTPRLGTFQYTLESRGSILVVPQSSGPNILLHRTAK